MPRLSRPSPRRMLHPLRLCRRLMPRPLLPRRAIPCRPRPLRLLCPRRRIPCPPRLCRRFIPRPLLPRRFMPRLPPPGPRPPPLRGSIRSTTARIWRISIVALLNLRVWAHSRLRREPGYPGLRLSAPAPALRAGAPSGPSYPLRLAVCYGFTQEKQTTFIMLSGY
jgi:hypothetical protein